MISMYGCIYVPGGKQYYERDFNIIERIKVYKYSTKPIKVILNILSVTKTTNLVTLQEN